MIGRERRLLPAGVAVLVACSSSACVTHRFNEPKAEHLAYVQTATELRWLGNTRVLRCGRSYVVGSVYDGRIRDLGEVFPPDSPARELGEEAERQSRKALGFWITGLLTAGAGTGLVFAGSLQEPVDEGLVWAGLGVAVASVIPVLIASGHQMKARVAFEDAINTYNDAVALDPSLAQCDTYTWPDPPEDFERED